MLAGLTRNRRPPGPRRRGGPQGGEAARAPRASPRRRAGGIPGSNPDLRNRLVKPSARTSPSPPPPPQQQQPQASPERETPTELLGAPHAPTQGAGASQPRAPPGRSEPADRSPPLRTPEQRSRPSAPRLSPPRAVTAPRAAATRLPPPHSPPRRPPRERRARLEEPRQTPLTRGGGTRGAECRGAPSPLSSSPVRRSALRGTPARPGLPSQSDGTPPPLAVAALPPPLSPAPAEAGAATGAILVVTQRRGRGSRPRDPITGRTRLEGPQRAAKRVSGS